MKTKIPTAPITIDKNIPLPVKVTENVKKNGRVSKYPFKDLKLGHSFFVPNTTSQRFSPNASQFKKGNKGFHFTVRAWTEKKVTGVRVWRIKPVKKEKAKKA